MKKSFFVFLIISLVFVLSVSAGASYDVSDRARIGIKYGSSAVSSPSVSSTTGSFDFSFINKDIVLFATYSTKNITVSAYSSYLVLEQSYFESFDTAQSYSAQRENMVPFIKDGVIYAVYYGLTTQDEANLSLENAKLYNETAYIISPDTNLIKVADKSGKTIFIFSQSENEKLGISATNEGLMDFGNQDTYRDIIEFIRVGNVFNLISNVTMQHYLYSVIPAEIGASAPLEAQKAQAVCARTYYEENIGRHKNDGFSLCGTTHCQMYIGTKWEREQSNRAVDETENMILTYNGKPISAVYFAHSGGVTANVEDVWGTPYPYLKSSEDKYCTDYTWEVTIDYDSLTEKMKNNGYDIGEVTDVKVTKTSDYGLVTELTISGTKGEKKFLREKARTILSLKSQNFTIPSENITKFAKTKKGTETVSVTKILTKDGVKEIKDSVSVINGNKQVSTLTKKAGNVIYGKGYGHHVGFSQHGAMEYAKEGWDYKKILKHYYQGVEIEGE